MAKAKRIRAASGEVDFNMTPMIDVTFQLIIFFIIAGQMVSEELAALIPPKPYQSLASEELNNTRWRIVNISSKAGNDPNAADSEAREADEWRVGGERIPINDREALVAKLLAEMARDQVPPEEVRDLIVEIRADYRVPYSAVEPVLLALRDAGIGKMNITAIVEPPE